MIIFPASSSMSDDDDFEELAYSPSSSPELVLDASTLSPPSNLRFSFPDGEDVTSQARSRLVEGPVDDSPHTPTPPTSLYQGFLNSWRSGPGGASSATREHLPVAARLQMLFDRR
ncbi:hypothetical protein EW146_g58 [Bondarzewia mesenterica]|uniref:Uncharacterized protein n=1 Tax=Bondarzewia mesenterica TaxID=1095465 RepID=A0A4S4M869_9AGAM|nr:hypothetical protein EW146_g58 [Bondarzewia mesenterica]